MRPARNKPRDRSHMDASLVIHGKHLDPAAVSKVLGLQPTKQWRAGEALPMPAPGVHKDSAWLFKGKAVAGFELTKHVEALLKQIEPYMERFAHLPPDITIYISCGVCDYEFRRSNLSLSRSAIEGLAKLGAEIDIDYYDLSRADSDE